MTGFDWHARAACRDMDSGIFFEGRTDYAREICEGCPVRNRCLEYAVVTNQSFGVWGGTTPAMRRKIRKQIGETNGQSQR